MRRDHYVSQTYLKHYCNENKKLWVYAKEHLDVHERSTRSICWGDNWSTNPFYKNERIIEEYLKFFENNWATAVKKVGLGNELPYEQYLDQKSILAGYISYLKLFSPCAVRAGSNFLKKTVKAELLILRDKGLLPPPPPGHEYLLDDLENQIKIDIDEKYPHAVGMRALIDSTQKLCGMPWSIIHNDTTVPFVTSDHPACNWFVARSQIAITYFPLTPKLAILIKPPIPFVSASEDRQVDKIGHATRHFVEKMNALIIKSASRYVISNIRSEETLAQVKEYQRWAHGSQVSELHTPGGTIIVSKWGPMRMKSVV